MNQTLKTVMIFTVLIVMIAGTLALCANKDLGAGWMHRVYRVVDFDRIFAISEHRREEARSQYARLKTEIADRRKMFQGRYAKAGSTEKQRIIVESRRYVFSTLTERILPMWLDTRWSYHGTAEYPLNGSIACGYFVATTLRDAGFNIGRVINGQAAALHVIHTLTSRANYISINPSNGIHKTLYKKLKQNGPAIYIIGFDNHNGFALNDGEEIYLCHTGWYKVVSEPVTRSPVVRNQSKHGLHLGRLLEDRAMIAWITGERIPHYTKLDLF